MGSLTRRTTPNRSQRASVATPRVLAAMVFTAAMAVIGAACESTPPDRDLTRDLINVSRAGVSAAPLQENVMLDVKADNWARHLRDQCALSHSRLADGAPPGWKKLGENVGMGGSIEAVHDAYLASPGHQANIVDPAFTQVGTAAVWGDCNGFHMVFTVQVFMK